MKIIEFFGLPLSGKTYYEAKLSKIINKNYLYNYNTIFIYYLFKIKKITWIEFFILKKYFNKKNYSNKKNKNLKEQKISLYKIIKKKIYLRFAKKIFKEKIIYFKKNKRKYSVYLMLVDLILKGQEKTRVKTLKRWTIDQIVAFDIAKKDNSNNLMINSESFVQRILSYNFYSRNKNIKINFKILNHMPKSDYFIYIKSNKREIIDRMKKLNYINSFYPKKINTLNCVLKNAENYLLKNCFKVLYKKNFIDFIKNKFTNETR
jgi:hypothetical protein